MIYPKRNKLFNEIYWDICTDLGIDIKSKDRHIIYISGRNIFIVLMSDLFGLAGLANGQPRTINTTIIGEYLGVSHGTVVTTRKKGWLVSDKASLDCYKRLKDKYSSGKYDDLIRQIKKEYYLLKAKKSIESL